MMDDDVWRLILMSASVDGRRVEPWGALEPM